MIVNELGEVAIDHHLLRRVDERTVLLKSGCVCCSLRGDLADELRDLLGRRERGRDSAVPARRGRDDRPRRPRADPLHAAVRAGGEAPLPARARDRDRRRRRTGCAPPESVKQAAAADRLVVTKTDLADAGALAKRLARLNPTAEVHRGLVRRGRAGASVRRRGAGPARAPRRRPRARRRRRRLLPLPRRGARLGRLRRLADDAPAEPGRRPSAGQGAAERRRPRARSS